MDDENGFGKEALEVIISQHSLISGLRNIENQWVNVYIKNRGYELNWGEMEIKT